MIEVQIHKLKQELHDNEELQAELKGEAAEMRNKIKKLERLKEQYDQLIVST